MALVAQQVQRLTVEVEGHRNLPSTDTMGTEQGAGPAPGEGPAPTPHPRVQRPARSQLPQGAHRGRAGSSAACVGLPVGCRPGAGPRQ